jgi:hypothetical protein
VEIQVYFKKELLLHDIEMLNIYLVFFSMKYRILTNFTEYANRELFPQKSICTSFLKPFSQLKLNFTEIVIGWSPI